MADWFTSQQFQGEGLHTKGTFFLKIKHDAFFLQAAAYFYLCLVNGSSSSRLTETFRHRIILLKPTVDGTARDCEHDDVTPHAALT